jgi:hypothetical protein
LQIDLVLAVVLLAVWWWVVKLVKFI